MNIKIEWLRYRPARRVLDELRRRYPRRMTQDEIVAEVFRSTAGSPQYHHKQVTSSLRLLYTEGLAEAELDDKGKAQWWFAFPDPP